MNTPLTPVEWKPAWRIIPSRFPPTDLFERIAERSDFDALIALESLTNDRLRDRAGTIRLVPPEDRTGEEGTSTIMAAFTHLNPGGSRFSDGSYGVLYCAHALDTAISETRYHRELFLRATQEAPIEIDMRVYVMTLRARLHDICHRQTDLPDIYDKAHYSGGQHFALTLRKSGSDGIVYSSVRHEGGICAAAFRPRLLSQCRQERHLCYVWNGNAITQVYQKQLYG